MSGLNQRALQSLGRNDAYGDFYYNISKRFIPGLSSEFKFGRSTAIGTTESIVWDGGGNYIFLEAAEKLSIVSDDANDNILGTGARTIAVFGLGVLYNPIFEILALDGLTPVLTEQLFLRNFRALILTSGTNDPILDANIGTISMTGNDTSALQSRILPHIGQTLMAVYTIPAGKTGRVTGIAFTAGQGKQCLFKAKFRNAPAPDGAFSVKFTMDLFEVPFFGDLKVPLSVPEKTDIVITGETTVGTIDASASFGIILEDN